MDIQRLMNSIGGGGGGAGGESLAADAPTNDNAETIHISSLALLKVNLTPLSWARGGGLWASRWLCCWRSLIDTVALSSPPALWVFHC